MRRIFIVLLFALVGLTGTTSAEWPPRCSVPPGGQVATQEELGLAQHHTLVERAKSVLNPTPDVLRQAWRRDRCRRRTPDLAAVTQYGEFADGGIPLTEGGHVRSL